MFDHLRRIKSSPPSPSSSSASPQVIRRTIGVISVRATIRRLKSTHASHAQAALGHSATIGCVAAKAPPREPLFNRFFSKEHAPFWQHKKQDNGAPPPFMAPWFANDLEQNMVPSSPDPTTVSTVQMMV